MSAQAFHLNLLNPLEMKAASPVRLKIILPIAAGIVGCFVLAWGTFIGVQYLMLLSQISGVKGEIDALSRESAENEALLIKLSDQQAEAAQFSYYLNGRNEYGGLLKELAYAIPEGITLKSLSIPPQPDQGLRFPAALRLPPLQGPTQRVEQVELRLVGIAAGEKAVFEMMENFKRGALTGMVSIVESPKKDQRESPRVIAFRQETSSGGQNNGDVFFDLVYDLKPREFAK